MRPDGLLYTLLPILIIDANKDLARSVVDCATEGCRYDFGIRKRSLGG
jgi:hypothetical protein